MFAFTPSSRPMKYASKECDVKEDVDVNSLKLQLRQANLALAAAASRG